MSIKSDLKKAGIEVTQKLDTLTTNKISNNIAKKIVARFSNFGIDEHSIFSKLSRLNMYKAKMPEGIAEANYFYKNCSIYFNNNICDEDLEEFAIHECLHYLQEVKDEKNNLLKMGLCTYSSFRPHGLGLNEAAVQYLSSKIIGIKPDFEKYYGINLYTPSPSYYPLECALLNEILYFIDEDVLFDSTFFSNDKFKNAIIQNTSSETFSKLEKSFDLILKLEEKIVLLNNSLLKKEENSTAIYKINTKLNKLRQEISFQFIETQNLIITSFFDKGFEQIEDLETLEKFRRKLYKFTDIIGTVDNYNFFDNYYVLTMNKLEHKCNILENGGIETAISKNKNAFFRFLNKFKKLFSVKENEIP